MMDAEIAFCDFNKNMDYQEELIQYIISEVITIRSQELTII